MNLTTGPMPLWLKRVIAIAGLFLALPGLPAAFGFFCIALLLTFDGDRQAVSVGLVSFTLMVVTTGAGGAAFWHGLASLQSKPSKLLFLPPIWILAGVFGLLVATGLFVSAGNFASGLIFPPILLVAATVPPLLAVSWFIHQSTNGLTWRRGLVAFAGGATVSVIIALVMSILLPVIILALVFDLADVALTSLKTLFEALAGADVASALTSPGFIFVFIQIAIIAPLTEELAKPLVTLPLIARLPRRDAFLVGAVAGAGFAAVENVLYAGFGFSFWAGILVVRALGGAIHPLGSGLVALGWRDVLRGEVNAGVNWFARFGLAAGLHALWNGGSLLVITLAGAQFFGELPPAIDILGLSAAGTTLALLIILGLAALWIGRAIGRNLKMPQTVEETQTETNYVLSDRALAIWALACLVMIVPAGIAGLQIVVR